MKEKKRLEIIKKLTSVFETKLVLNPKDSNLSPGNFLFFNMIFKENKINLNDDFLDNLILLLNLYKKNKDMNLVNTIMFLIDFYFYNLQKKQKINIEKIIENKSFVIKNINKFIVFNLNQNSLINAINSKISNG